MSEQFISRRGQNRKNVLILGILAILVLGWGVRFYYLNKDPESPSNALARIASQNGSFRVKRDNKQIHLEADSVIMPGDRVRTRPGASVEIEYLDETTRLNLGGGTILIFEDPEQGKKFRLQAGSVSLNVPSLPDEGGVVAESSNAVATVRRSGRFQIDFHGMRTLFRALSGRLHIRRFRDGHETLIETGNSFCCKPEKGEARITFQEETDS